MKGNSPDCSEGNIALGESIFYQLGLGRAQVMCLKGWAPQADLVQLWKGRSGTWIQMPEQGLDTGINSLEPPQLLPHTLQHRIEYVILWVYKFIS